MKKVKMVFFEDKFLDGKCVFSVQDGTPMEVEPQSVDRWLKRGGTIVPDDFKAVVVEEAEKDHDLGAKVEDEETSEEVEEVEDGQVDEESQSPSPSKPHKKKNKKNK